MTTQKKAKQYLSKDWKVLPIPKGSKAPIIKDWPGVNITEEELFKYFSDSENIGVKLGKPSKWLTDIDLDCKEAIQVAEYFLPSTEAIFGRETKPRSHWLYYCLDSVTSKYQFEGITICELRSTGAQTVFPPSIHPEGDIYIWDKEGEPRAIPFNLLKRAVAKLASCVLLARNYPGRGARQDAILPLTGWLFRGGWNREDIEIFITALCELAQDEEINQRTGQIKNTITKIENDLPATGYPTLTEYYPEEVLRKVGEWLELKPERPPIEEMEAQKDYGHALVLSSLFHNKYRWVTEWGKWIEYKKGVWKPTSEEKVAKEATERLHKYYTQELNNARDKNKITEINQKIKEVWTYSRIIGALNFLRGFPDIMTSAQELDAIPGVLNLENGTLDLKTLTLNPHNPGDLLTKQVKAKWDTEAKKDKWQEHLNLFLPNKNIQREIQRELGLALTGLSLEEILPIWYGIGANGKSTTLRVIMDVMGDYAQMASPRLLIKSKYERHTTELAELQGRRLIFSTETGEGGELDEEKMKWLTGGERVRARFMRQDNFEFPRTWIVFLVTNYKPTIKGTDEGTWRRIRLVPWEILLPLNERIPQEKIIKTLLTERDGILQWLVDGLRDWKEDPHWIAEEVLFATETYREEEDILRGFLNERCELKPRYTVEVGALYSEYENWCKENEEEAKNKIEFGKLLRKRGIHQKREAGTGKRKWKGIKIKNNTGNNDEPENKPKKQEKNDLNAYNEADLNDFSVTRCDSNSILTHENNFSKVNAETLSHLVTENDLKLNSEALLNPFFSQNNIEEKEGGKLDISKNEENGEGKNNTENKCKICEHKEREKIEYLFDSGMEVNYLSKRFNVSVGGLNTHLTSHRKAPPGELE